MGELADRRLDVRLVAHPVFGVTRADGKLTALGAPMPPAMRAKASSISISTPIDERGAALEIVRALQVVLGEVRQAVQRLAADARPRQRHRRRSRKPIRRLCRWMRSPKRSSSCNGCCADNFTFLGVRDYSFDHGSARRPISRPRSASCASANCACCERGGELLECTPEIMAFLQRAAAADHRQGQHARPRASARLSRLYRRQAVRRRRQSHRRAALRRAVYLHRLYPLGARHPLSAPQDRRGRAARRLLVRQSFRQGAGQCAGALSARRIVPGRRGHASSISRSPSCSSTSTRACACWRGATASTVSCRCWSMFRARITTARMRVKIGDYLARAFGGRVSAFYPFFPEGPLVRVHFIIGRSGGPTPEVARATLERESPPSCAAGATGLPRRWRSNTPAGRGARFFDRYSDGVFRRLPRGLFAGGGRRRRAHDRRAFRRAPARRRFPPSPGRRAARRRPEGVEPGAAAAAVRSRAGAGEHGFPRGGRAHVSYRGHRATTARSGFTTCCWSDRDGGAIDLTDAEEPARNRVPDGHARRRRKRRLQRAHARRRPDLARCGADPHAVALSAPDPRALFAGLHVGDARQARRHRRRHRGAVSCALRSVAESFRGAAQAANPDPE